MKILLIGDSSEDEYIYGRCDEISSEAPVPIMKLSRVETKSGMSGNICLNLQAFQLDITFLTHSEKITRTRFIDERTNIQILQIDNEEKIKPLLLPISTNNFDAIVISDYDKGYLTESKLFEIVEISDCPVFICSKKTFLPNKENCFIIIEDYQCEKLSINNNIHNFIIIKDAGGCTYKNKLYPSKKIDSCDRVWANDIFMSTLVYGYLKCRNIDKAIIMANKSYEISSQKSGVHVLTEKDILTINS